MLRYLDPHNSEEIFNSQQVNKWLPIDFYNGADHATAHMIYARFMTRFFHKLGLVDNPEPFKKFLFNGKVTAADGQMFSKSKGNGVDPLEIINSGYGADALRTYLMFAAPLELSAKWDAQGVPGTYRFLNRVWNIVQEYLELQPGSATNNDAPLRIIHPAIKKVTSDIEEQKYNTAIAALMQACNSLYDLKAKSGFDDTTSWRQALESLVMLVAPFAPHISEQLWHDLGHEDSVNKGNWPVWDDKFLASDTMTIAVQVNGKLRAEIEVPSDADQSAVLAAAKANQKVAGYLTSDPIKTIYVPGRLLSLVVRA
jgi:leucyl-tRNA synthetase